MTCKKRTDSGALETDKITIFLYIFYSLVGSVLGGVACIKLWLGVGWLYYTLVDQAKL